RYRRQDEAGTPYCFTIDGQTLQDNTITIRDRDTLKQERLPLAEVAAKLHDLLKPEREQSIPGEPGTITTGASAPSPTPSTPYPRHFLRGAPPPAVPSPGRA